MSFEISPFLQPPDPGLGSLTLFLVIRPCPCCLCRDGRASPKPLKDDVFLRPGEQLPSLKMALRSSVRVSVPTTIVLKGKIRCLIYIYFWYLMEVCFLSLREFCTLLMHNNSKNIYIYIYFYIYLGSPGGAQLMVRWPP